MASLERLLPLIAEASPEEFLKAVEAALIDIEKSPFHKIFAQESSDGIAGRNYISGLLWALEGLAWHSDYLTRVILIFGDLASIDPGGNWANRPLNSLTDILLPWHLQTCANMKKRIAAIETLIKEHSKIGWKLLLTLLPRSHGTTSGCRRPIWRDLISPDWKNIVTTNEYWEQITVYTEMAVKIARSDRKKLNELINRISDLSDPARDKIINHLTSEPIINLPEIERLPIWETLNNIVRKYRKFSDAQWAMSENVLIKIEKAADALTPNSPDIRYRYLFGERYYNLYDEKGNYEEQKKRLEDIRENALTKILDTGGISYLLNFALNVSDPFQVGFTLGNIASNSIEKEILPKLLISKNEFEKKLIKGFVWSRFWKEGKKWEWADNLLTNKWNVAQKSVFLTLLPFEKETWMRANKHLKTDEGLYWQNSSFYPSKDEQHFTECIKKFIQYNRPNAAIRCLGHVTYKKKDFNAEFTTLATKALLGLINSKHPQKELDQHRVIELIIKLQKSPHANIDDLFIIEWNLLNLLDQFSEGSPKTLENRLASDPKFFCELIGLVFLSEKEKENKKEPTEQRKNLAEQAYKLLDEWKTPPGTQPDGSFDPASFKNWLKEVKQSAKDTGHLNMALLQIGCVLINAIATNNLWIHPVVAEALNNKDAEQMRLGFTTQLFNSRGVCISDGGKNTLELAKKNRKKAEQLDEQGYFKFAAAMRDFALSYERQAEEEASSEIYDKMFNNT